MLLRSPLRWYTFRIMILTSLVWVIFGMCILVYYMECLAGQGVNCHRKGLINQPAPLVNLDENQAEKKNLDIHSSDEWPHLRLPPYQESQLHTWVAPSKLTCLLQVMSLIFLFIIIIFNTVLRSNPKSWPGENGKGVDTPKDQEELKQEKFKLNQFNLLASDKIALNRSLSDVRLDG